MSDKTYETSVTQANDMQRKAAIPTASVFVSANAGSGKTRVLVDRVSRILLCGTKPDKILCLTYTKAAASEMQARLFEKLGDWSILGEDALTAQLNNLEGIDKKRTPEELGKARLLFARALETPGGLKVQTIHAFCERLLKRFPLEAGLSPGTDALDDGDARILQTMVQTQIEQAAIEDPSGDIAAAIRLLAAHKNDETMNGFYTWAMGNAYNVDTWREDGGPDKLMIKLGLKESETAQSYLENFWARSDKTLIKQAAQAMMQSGPRDKGRGVLALAALEEGGVVDAFDLYGKVFCSGAGKGSVFKQVASGKASDIAKDFFGNDKECPSAEASRVLAARDRLRAYHVLALTRAVYSISILAVEKYRALKHARRFMDFDDQIYLAKNLLTQVEARDWVRYKLDGGVDHILVDEAQDTSAAQWEIIDALSAEFFQPSPDHDTRFPRTLFAVGDEKQSIYSFQGARPEQFLDKIQTLSTLQTPRSEVKMSMSFRSNPQILGLVDQVFYKDRAIQDMFDADKFAPASDEGFHTAHRRDQGLIEFWPAVKTPEKPKIEHAWKPQPVDTPNVQDAREQLARQIALHIKNWLESGESVFDRKLKHARPMRAGDIMILVKKRLSFFDAVIRNLKDVGVPVAGADRLSIKDSIAVKDLLSLAKFSLLPSDDLSLAEVLRSPLIGWSEQQLFDVAHGRTGTLWAALPKGDIRDLLLAVKSMAHRYAPYEFFARTLAMVPKAGGDSLLQNFLTRMGVEITDALDAFLSSALVHQRRGAPSLTAFIKDTLSDEHKIKREMSGADDASFGEVRVMTVHAAKGLEAPVVILPDTTQVPSVSKQSIFSDGDGFVIGVSAQERPEALEKIVQDRTADQERENLRLLYVALTRAESRLLICGFESNKKVAENSWYARIEVALHGLDGVHDLETEFGIGRAYGGALEPVQDSGELGTAICELPNWLRKNPAITQTEIRHYSPSRLANENEEDGFSMPVRSPLSIAGGTGAAQFRRGNIIHKLLQILPDITPQGRRSAASAYLANMRMEPNESAQIISEVFAVLEHEDFAFIFAPGSQAEVSLIGGAAELPDNIVLNGQIDRLVTTEDTVWIVDYKSNRPPPSDAADVAQIYIRQMAAYRALVRELYPNKTVRAALLWTDGLRLMELPASLLDKVDWNAALSA